MNSIIIFMTLMGSSIVTLYLIFKPLFKKFFSVKFRIYFLEVSILFYLIPLPLLKKRYMRIIRYLFNYNILQNDGDIVKLNNPIYILPNKDIIFPKINIFIILGIILWIVVILIRFIYHINIYKKLKQYIVASSYITNDNNIENLIQKYKLEYHIKRKISILMGKYNEPITLGFIKPIIILPNNMNLEKYKLEFIIKHELMHIYHKDCFIKIIVLITSILHWFNPFVYILSNEINKLLEYYADESVVVNLNRKEKILYGNTIIDISTINNEEYSLNNILINHFKSNSEKNMKERLKEIKSVKKYKNTNSIISMLILIIVIICNSMIVFGYQEYHTEEISESYPIERIYENNDEYFIKKETEDKTHFLPLSYKTQVYFIDENSNIYLIPNQSENTKSNCQHTYINGHKVLHTRDNNGGCKEEHYNSKYCSKCYNTISEDLDYIITYKKCKH